MKAERNGFAVETVHKGRGHWTTTVTHAGVVLATARYFSAVQAVLGHAKRVAVWLDGMSSDGAEAAAETMQEQPMADVIWLPTSVDAPTMH